MRFVHQKNKSPLCARAHRGGVEKKAHKTHIAQKAQKNHEETPINQGILILKNVRFSKTKSAQTFSEAMYKTPQTLAPQRFEAVCALCVF